MERFCESNSMLYTWLDWKGIRGFFVGKQASEMLLLLEVGEYFLGTSLTTSSSHSSAIQAVGLSCPIIKSKLAFSASWTTTSIVEFNSAVTSAESGWFEFPLGFVSYNLVDT
ncbi:hypothetical protein OWV82_001782 [Melia azedarach]|uniref:Uncharacterized protein n=1 Tax=Melia azedarach TaxID=155640 RepID=A0ACC1Z0W7_MELAZ|nr:hypothetical protein OWV82_001782 [Melia azedarach]